MHVCLCERDFLKIHLHSISMSILKSLIICCYTPVLLWINLNLVQRFSSITGIIYAIDLAYYGYQPNRDSNIVPEFRVLNVIVFKKRIDQIEKRTIKTLELNDIHPQYQMGYYAELLSLSKNVES